MPLGCYLVGLQAGFCEALWEDCRHASGKLCRRTGGKPLGGSVGGLEASFWEAL